MYPGKGPTTQLRQVLVYNDSTGRTQYTNALGPIDNITGFPIGTFSASLFTVRTVSSSVTVDFRSGSGAPSTTSGSGAMYLRTDGAADTALYFQVRAGVTITQSINDYTPLRATARWGDPVRLVATLNNVTSGLSSVDSVSFSTNDRILLTNQTTTSQCGIFTANSSTWIRAKDANSASTTGVLGSKVGSGSINYVSEGTIFANRFFFVANSDPFSADIAEVGGGGVTLVYSEWITGQSFTTFTQKQPVRTASRTNLALSGLGTVGGVSLVAGDRVLVLGQTTQANNGIYVASAGAWSRSTDANSNGFFKLLGMVVYVSEGTDAGAVFYLTPTTVFLGTTALTYAQLGSSITTVTPITTNYTVLSTDCTIAVGAIVAPITVTLPATPSLGRVIYVKDVTGVGATQNITVSGNGNTIDGSATSLISTNFGSLALEFTGVEWSIVG